MYRWNHKRCRRRVLHNLLLGWIALLIASCGVSTAEQPLLTAIRNQVLHQPKGKTAEEIAENVERLLNTGDAIDVNEQGRASLNFNDALKVELFRDTRLSIVSEVDKDASALEIYALEGGTTLNQFELGEIAQKRVRLTTEWAVIEDFGTEFITHFNPDTEITWVIVRSGVVDVSNQPPNQQTVRVNAGEQTWVIPQQPPVQPVPAVRAQIGNLVPPLQALTNGVLTDAAWLPALTGFAASQITLTSGQSAQATLTISGEAYEGGILVTLTSTDPGAANVPVTVTVPEGQTTQTFTITAQPVSQPTTVDLFAAYGDAQHKITLTILPPVANASPTPGPTITPTSTPVPPTFTPTPTPSPTITPTSSPTITPTPTSTPTITPTPSPPALADLTLSPATIEGGNPAQGVVTLGAPAPAGGATVALKSSVASVTVPDSVTVPEGEIRAPFDIATRPVTQQIDAIINASLGSSAIEKTLIVTPPPLPDLTVALGDPAVDVSCSGEPGCFVTVVFTVSNAGSADVTQRFFVLVQADNVEAQTIVINGLPAGESVQREVRLGPGGNCFDPDCTASVTVDPNDLIQESDDENNIDTFRSIG